MFNRGNVLRRTDFIVASSPPQMDSYVRVVTENVCDVNLLSEFLELHGSNTWQLIQTCLEFESHLLDNQLHSIDQVSQQLLALSSKAKLSPKYWLDYQQLSMDILRVREDLQEKINFKNQYPLHAMSIIFMPLLAEKKLRASLRSYCLDVLRYVVSHSAIKIFRGFCGEPGAPGIDKRLVEQFNQAFLPLGIRYEESILRVNQVDLGASEGDISKKIEALLTAAEALSWSGRIPGFPHYARTVLEENLISFKQRLYQNCQGNFLKEAFDFFWGQNGPYTIEENKKMLGSTWSKAKFVWNWGLTANDWGLQGVCSESGAYEMVWGIDRCFSEDSRQALVSLMQASSLSQKDGTGNAQQLLQLGQRVEQLGRKASIIQYNNAAGLLFSCKLISEEKTPIPAMANSL